MSVRFRILLTVTLIFFAGHVAADAATDCNQTRDPQLQVSACTELINRGFLNGRNLAFAYNNRAIGRKELKQYDGAIADIDRAISIDPQLAIAYNTRGTIYQILEKFDQARADYDRAIAINPMLAKVFQQSRNSFSRS